MDCSHFETNIDAYLDGVLARQEYRRAAEHVAICARCDVLVTSYQQASALLSAAVTDQVAAVDVSGLWEAIDRDLGPVSAATGVPPRVRRRQAGVGTPWLSRIRGWAVEGAPWRLGLAAAAAVLALMWMAGGDQTTPERVARAKAKTKAVRIEALEVPSGYTVSTWARPRSRTRVIAINPAAGYAVAPVSYSPR